MDETGSCVWRSAPVFASGHRPAPQKSAKRKRFFWAAGWDSMKNQGRERTAKSLPPQTPPPLFDQKKKSPFQRGARIFLHDGVRRTFPDTRAQPKRRLRCRANTATASCGRSRELWLAAEPSRCLRQKQARRSRGSRPNMQAGCDPRCIFGQRQPGAALRFLQAPTVVRSKNRLSARGLCTPSPT